MMRGIGAGARGDHLWPKLTGLAGERVVVDPLVFLAHAVVRDLEEFAREVCLVAVREMAAMREVHRQDPVAGLQHGEIDRHVGLRAGVRLHVDVLGAEKLLGAVDGQLLDDVDVLTAAIPAPAWIALGVFVREAGALRLHDRPGGEILRGDQLDVFKLPQLLRLDRRVNFRDRPRRAKDAWRCGCRVDRAFPPGARAARLQTAWLGTHRRSSSLRRRST